MSKKVGVRNKQELDSRSGKRKKGQSRRRGHSCERKYARYFREELGFEHCKTTRETSKLLDDCQIDLAFIPLNIQIKKGYADRRPRADVIFKEMKARLEKNFPAGEQIHDLPPILIHDLDGTELEDTIVSMRWCDWVEFFKAYEKMKGSND